MTTLTTVLSAIAALFAVLIATLQYRNSNYRIKMDLFEKRYDFYLKLRDALSLCLGVINKEERLTIMRQIGECERLSIFLFDDEFTKEISQIRERVEEFCQVYFQLNGENKLSENDDRDKVVVRKTILFEKIKSDIDTLEIKLKRFMKLNK